VPSGRIESLVFSFLFLFFMTINLAEKLSKENPLLAGKVAVVTGGKQGMGRVHSITLAQAGAKVVVSDISEEECQQVVEEIKEKGGEAIPFKCDVSKKDEVDTLMGKAIDEYGSIDILINNAGVVQFKPFLQKEEKDWDQTININLKGQFICAQAAAEKMAEQGSGSIVNISSVAMGQNGGGMATITDYCASKGGIAGMTQAMATELAPQNIRVNAVSPGMIETPMIDPIMGDEDQKKNTLDKVPMGRVGTSQEISNLALFLSSDAASYITGSIIIADGGWTAAL